MNKKILAAGLALVMGIAVFPTINSKAKVYNGWEKSDSDWYYYRDGCKETGWVSDEGKWYYFNDDGSMKTGWLQFGTSWYYLNTDGAMVTGWYHEDDDGSLIEGTIPNYNGYQYYFNENGEWVENTNDSFRILVDDDITDGDKSILITVINRTDHAFEFNADENFIEKNENGTWNSINTNKYSKKIGKKIVYAHSSVSFYIDADTFESGKIEAGYYKVLYYLGDRYYEGEFEVTELKLI